MSSTITEASRVRLELGRELLPTIIRETTLAVAIGGSTAGGYAGPNSDLDLIIIDDSVTGGGGKHEVVKGISVSHSIYTKDFPFSLIEEDPSGFWAMREAARVRNCVILFERDGILTKIKERVRHLSLSPEYVKSILDEAAEQVERAERWISTEPELALLGLRVAFLLSLVPAFHSHLLPPNIYYSKPKWEWRTVSALGRPNILNLYRKLHDLDALTYEGVRQAVSSLKKVIEAVKESDPVRHAAPHMMEWAWTEEFLSDVLSLSEEGQVEATMGPLQFALFEMSSIVAEATCLPYEWAPDGMIALKKLLPPELYEKCKVAVSLRPKAPEQLSAYATEVRAANREIKELLTCGIRHRP